MSKAARNREKRRAAPAPVRREWSSQARIRLVWIATGVAAVVVAIVVGVILATRSSPSTPAAAPASAADRNAPPSLVAAANAVGFHPTTEPGVGQIEGQPATAAQPASTPLLAVGSTAPGFTLATPQGQTVSLAQDRGKAVLLEFFATWCPHCNAETPHLRTIYASLPKSTYAFLSIDADGETAPSVFAFHRYYGLQYPALLDPGFPPGSFSSQGGAGKVSTAYKVASYPTFYILDPKGRVFWASDGEQPDALLRQELHAAALHAS